MIVAFLSHKRVDRRKWPRIFVLFPVSVSSRVACNQLRKSTRNGRVYRLSSSRTVRVCVTKRRGSVYDSVNYSNEMDLLLKLIDRRCTVEVALGFLGLAH